MKTGGRWGKEIWKEDPGTKWQTGMKGGGYETQEE